MRGWLRFGGLTRVSPARRDKPGLCCGIPLGLKASAGPSRGALRRGVPAIAGCAGILGGRRFRCLPGRAPASPFARQGPPSGRIRSVEGGWGDDGKAVGPGIGLAAAGHARGPLRRAVPAIEWCAGIWGGGGAFGLLDRAPGSPFDRQGPPSGRIRRVEGGWGDDGKPVGPASAGQPPGTRADRCGERSLPSNGVRGFLGVAALSVCGRALGSPFARQGPPSGRIRSVEGGWGDDGEAVGLSAAGSRARTAAESHVCLVHPPVHSPGRDRPPGGSGAWRVAGEAMGRRPGRPSACQPPAHARGPLPRAVPGASAHT
jgi:hypothetical protein